MRLLPLLLLGSLALGLNAQAQSVYKITDPDGKVRYSDTRPADRPGQTVEERAAPDAKQNVLGSDPALRDWANQRQQERQAAAASARETWEQERQEAEARLQAAEKALEEGQVLGEEDLVGNRHGGARPSEEFNERVERLREEAREARTALDKVNARRPPPATSPTQSAEK